MAAYIEPSALSSYVFASRYSLHRPDLGRFERYEESCDRVLKMHADRYKGVDISVDLDFVRNEMHERRAIGSQRSLQFGGDAILRKHMRIYNCTATYVDRPRAFQEAFWVLLCGSGAGLSVQKHHVAKLPQMVRVVPDTKTFSVPDTIEGWADALGVLLASYGLWDPIQQPEFAPYVGHRVHFDYSQIREKGSVLSSSNGKAPGPLPLRNALENTRKLLKALAADNIVRLRPIHAYDILMYAADAVLSGGVRRSATIVLFSPDDEEMVAAKTGDWFNKNAQRGRSNNSAVLLRGETSYEQFAKFFTSTREFGEPGFFWVDDTEDITNPCFAKETRLATDLGLVQIADLVGKGPVTVTVDNRARKSGVLGETTGTRSQQATQVELTQRNAALYEVVTEHGVRLRATANHSFLTLEGRKQLAELEVGDVIPLQSGEGSFGGEGTFEDGLLLGALTGNGSVGADEVFLDVWEYDFALLDELQEIVSSRAELVALERDRTYPPLSWVDQVSNVPKKRIGGVRLRKWVEQFTGANARQIKDRVPEAIWRGSRDLVRGYLQGLFMTDGTVNLAGHKAKQTLSLRLGQANRLLLEDVQRLLLHFGVVTRLYSRVPAGRRLLPDGRGGQQFYRCKEMFELVIARPNCVLFEQKIGLMGRKGQQLTLLLDQVGRVSRKPERFLTRVSSVSYVGNEDVYCLTEPTTNSVIANGIAVGQCSEIGLRPNFQGESGVAVCNLSSINARFCNSKIENWERAARAAAILGTLQAGYTQFDYLMPVSRKIVETEALLGVSMTGMMDNPAMAFDPQLQRHLAGIVLATNAEIAAKIGINEAARLTAIKPEGSSSCLLDTSSGIHPSHAQRFLRRSQANEMEEALKQYRALNPRAVEKSVWNANGTDYVITFCIESEEGAITKQDLGAIELLERVRSTQLNWIRPGTRRERCMAPTTSHAVSNTVNVRDDEWDAVARYIYDHRADLAGVSLLSHSGDLDYPQAPFCAIKSEQELTEVYGPGTFLASGLIVDGLDAFNENLWRACDTALGIGEDLTEPVIPPEQHYTVTSAMMNVWHKRRQWVRRARQFAERYFGGDLRKMTHCLKDVHNFKLWHDLRREFRPVDYTSLPPPDTAPPMPDAACAGGSCATAYA